MDFKNFRIDDIKDVLGKARDRFTEELNDARSQIEDKCRTEEEKRLDAVRADARIFAKPFMDWYDSLNLDWDHCYKSGTSMIDIWYMFASYVYELQTMFPELMNDGVSKFWVRSKEIDSDDPRVREYHYQLYKKAQGQQYDEALVNLGEPEVYKFTFGGYIPGSQWKVPCHLNDSTYQLSKERAMQLYREWCDISRVENKPCEWHNYRVIFECCKSYMDISAKSIKNKIKLNINQN